ncbi:MAG: DUF1816 domain-containing protein [Leptolyngbya sp. SIO4C5]|uniref:DUF1816 domain-containing protein n=1 Tax=Sphaerothrix gracilis TaxID=3151835 RepID=UPI0013BEEBBB|nr:DUF1816 domain-containing protein [Leptolyngbya sp. SIO4C5]
MKNLLNGIFNLFAGEWWIEIVTQTPKCTYFFGPFSSEEEAQIAQVGYIEDLEQEGAVQIASSIQRCSRPEELTIDESTDGMGGIPSPALG